MNDNLRRAEIIAYGLVQGVGFRYYVYRHAVELGLRGFVQNLYSGEVLTVIEGNKASIEDLFLKIKVGPIHSDVRNCKISWSEPKNEFSDFQIKGW